MDAFFASVEIRRRPELRGKPVIVGATGSRGVVAAASYEARYYGIHSAMSSVRARRLCRDAIFLPGDHAHYIDVSSRVMAIFKRFTPLVEPLSLDEAFLDVRGARALFGTPAEIAAKIRSLVLTEQQLTCSVGVASSKFLAKLATSKAKPGVSREGPVFGTGVHVVEAGTELGFLHPHPVRAIFGVGRTTARRLGELGITTVAQLAAYPEAALKRSLGAAAGVHLHRLANGIDKRPVVVDRAPASIGHERTFARDLYHHDEIQVQLARLCEAMGRRLRSSGVAARTITIKVRFRDFKTVTRSITLKDPTAATFAIVEAARGLLEKLESLVLKRGVRLLGVSGSRLSPAENLQLSIDDLDSNDRDRHDSELVADEIRRRFGASAIGPAVLKLANSEGAPGSSGVDVQPWGPDAPKRRNR